MRVQVGESYVLACNSTLPGYNERNGRAVTVLARYPGKPTWLRIKAADDWQGDVLAQELVKATP